MIPRPTEQPDLPGLSQPPLEDTREVSGADLAGALAEINAQGGIVTIMEAVRVRNGVWRLRIRWLTLDPKAA